MAGFEISYKIKKEFYPRVGVITKLRLNYTRNRVNTMIYFFINMPLNELEKMEEKLPKGSFCLFQVQNATSRYYGIMKKDAYAAFMQGLGEETRKNLETIDKTVFQHFFLNNISDDISYIGNKRLMVYISDEN